MIETAHMMDHEHVHLAKREVRESHCLEQLDVDGKTKEGDHILDHNHSHDKGAVGPPSLRLLQHCNLYTGTRHQSEELSCTYLDGLSSVP